MKVFKNLVALILLLTINFLGAQATQELSEKMASSFIFDQDNLEENLYDIRLIYETMGKYYEGVEKASLSLLEEVFHEDWIMRDTDTPNESILNIEDKSKFIKRVKYHGPYPGYALDREFGAISIANKNLAFVRINKNSKRNATCFFLYKLNGKWMIMDKIWVNADEERAALHSSNEYSIIREMLGSYLAGVETSNLEILKNILHEDWDWKGVDQNGELTKQSRNHFNERIKGTQEHIGNHPMTSIDMYHKKLAVIRIDRPSKSETAFLILFKVNNNWKIASERCSYKNENY